MLSTLAQQQITEALTVPITLATRNREIDRKEIKKPRRGDQWETKHQSAAKEMENTDPEDVAKVLHVQSNLLLNSSPLFFIHVIQIQYRVHHHSIVKLREVYVDFMRIPSTNICLDLWPGSAKESQVGLVSDNFFKT